MILTVIKWYTVQGQLGSGQGARSCGSKMAAISSLIPFSSPGYRWRRKFIVKWQTLQRVINSLTLGKIILHLSLSFLFLKKKRERERLKLKLFTSVRDSDPQDQDSNPAKPHGFPTEITNLVSGPNKVQVLDVSSQKEFSERQSDR